MTYVLLLLAVALLVALNGLFVAAEFALVRSRRSRLEQMADEGDRRAARVIRQMDEMNSLSVGEPEFFDIKRPWLYSRHD